MLQKLVEDEPAAEGPAVDAKALASALRGAIDGEVRFDDGSRALYATDASNYRQVPIGVVIPRTMNDVLRTVEICRQHRAPILSRGGGTSLCGQCCNVAVVIDFSKHLNRILEIDPVGRTALVEPGVVLDDLRDAANRHGLTFAPDPATHTHNTLGGMIGNNSCGPHSVMGGETTHNVVELDVLTYEGERLRLGATSEESYQRILAEGGRRADIYRQLHALAARHADEIRRRFPPIPRRVSGYNLPALLPENGFNLAQAVVGSEGTCVVVLEARLRLVDWPPARSLLVLGYPSVYEAADHVPEVMQSGPIAVEGIDDRLVEDMKTSHIHPQYANLLPEGGGWLLVEFGGKDKTESHAQAKQLMEHLRQAEAPPTMKLYDDAREEEQVWKIRESGLGATAHVPDKTITWEGWEDSSVPPENLGKYLRQLRSLFEQYGYECDLYGHFGQGCVHTRIDFDLETAAGIAKYREFIHAAARLVTGLGGSVSGEHGDGQSKAELLPIMFGQEIMQAFRDFKAIWDPENCMNPGKIIDAPRADQHLRLGTSYDPPQVETAFAYIADQHDFARTVLRCVGVGECRKKKGVMCPSYMATGEEMHSTRGRARLLFEMLRGETVREGWREPAVKEALDLCLSCKGCKGECPVHVDMAAYKAEFLFHYYEGRLRPPAAYAFGLIDRWARLASHAPGFVNFLSQHQPFAGLAKRVVGIASERRIPLFAEQSFASRFRIRSQRASGKRILLWPDTFNNYFQPDVAQAAAAALLGAGFDVQVPPGHVCCGRPLYEFGMLDRARSYLLDILERLDGDIRAGTPIVMLEPACLTVFREELPEILPGNEQAKRLAQQSFLLSEFLAQEALDHAFGELRRKAVVHAHCHHKAVIKFDAEEAMLKKLGLDFEVLDSGCCGMAGSFGFEKQKYDVSMRCGERVLLPAVRAAAADTLIVADGYSCREQILQTTGRRPLHLAQLLQLAMQGPEQTS
ncbi:MAG TPA: FAD-binding and (Fe-S)-binding domain-containing protein [Aromatoleum sp.]|uniref:FAD-binding and (Fe-S)-binding domain-containing protein n=1 Tax=Aromatoleum sp. TaxID=2307007 RepID=UPI002B45D836|nr:FAD-binding and (Fe-S)-binding domain-containing protein [Aromatoleum sp.]HJV26920.1 FAD-binding and (Fe-S)-binding domain-containing protein [Aromatoleum sp.]